MRVTNMLPDEQYDMQLSQQQLQNALQQISTGLRVNQLSDDPAASASMVRSLADSATVDRYTSNINVTLSQMQTADSALASMVSAMNTAITAGTQGANDTETANNRQGAASQVASILSTMISLGNSSYQGTFFFGGSISTTQPFVAASEAYTSANGTAGSPLSSATALTAGSVTSISDATTGQTFTFKASSGDTIGTLQTAVANAVSAGTLSAGTTATINASGQLQIDTNNASNGIVVSSNDAALGSMNAVSGTSVANAYAYVGNDTVNTVEIGASLNVATNLPGGQLLTSGANVIGSLRNLINALQTGTSTQITDAVAGVTSAANYISQQRVPFDDTIAHLNAQESYLSQEKISLTQDQNALTGIDEATAATNLSQAEIYNNTVMAAAAKALPMTLLDYLK